MAMTDVAKKVWTEAELEALPEDGFIHEVVNGDLVRSPKNNWFHGRICTRLLIAIGNGFLEGGQLLPGFRYPIAGLFKDWEWE